MGHRKHFDVRTARREARRTVARSRPIVRVVRRYVHLFGVLGCVVIWAGIAASWVGWSYPFELLAHFQLQYLIAGAILAPLLLLFRYRMTALFVAAATAVVLWQMAPFWFARSGSAGGNAKPVRVLACNVLTANKNVNQLLAEIAHLEPDVIVLAEVNQSWSDGLVGRTNDFPHSIVRPREDNFGIGVWSRWPILEGGLIHIGDAGVPSVDIVLDIGSEPLRLIATHPLPPARPDGFSARNRQLADLAVRIAAGGDENIIVVGDLNVTPWSPHYRRLVARAGLRDARQGCGVRPTWPAAFPAPLRVPIDHCLYRGDLAILRCFLGQDVGSDHLPLIVDLLIREN